MKRKVTYQIDEQLLQSVRNAVDEGAVRTMSEFVEQALRERLQLLRREEIRRRIESAAADPLFVEDVRETTQAYDSTTAEGREQAGNRPALIVSDEAFNRNMEVVTILPITAHKEGRSVYPNEVLLEVEDSGLEARTIVMAHQIRTISRQRIKRRVGRLNSARLQEACYGAIQIHLGMY